MVDEFDWEKVAGAVARIVKKEKDAYEAETGKEVRAYIYYWGFVSKGIVEIYERKGFFGKTALAMGNIHMNNYPENDIKKGDLRMATGGNGFREHARHICEEYEKELKYRAFLRVVPNLT